ncbi:MAG: gliding motility-associated protein GldE [Bacteroidetes bacterium]|nr:gliding motility-associated protein GldE [Bacteroidota bacterium]
MDIPPGEQSQLPAPLLQILHTNLEGSDWVTFIMLLGGILFLLALSALFSASETAFFSLGPQSIKEIREKEDKASATTIRLLYNHRKLLATILIANNFVNVAIVFLSTFIFQKSIFDFANYPYLGFILQAIVVTAILVFLGEVFPKVYATARKEAITRMMALPLYWLSRALAPMVMLLEKSSKLLDKRMTKKGHQVSLDDINQAIDMTAEGEQSEDEKDILKGIVNYGNIPVKQIMRSRLDVSGLSIDTPYETVLEKVKELGYSRLPVYEENFDSIKGILYIKDLVPYIREKEYAWQDIIRPPYFVPESKKLDDLMSDFQEKRVHMAIVVDEYGGSSGLVTMEDVLEEIFGEIKDEFDDDDFSYSHLDDRTYVFEGKILLNDICRIVDMDTSIFEDVRGDSDTLGGMLIEIQGKIPNIGNRIKFDGFEFVVESADRRRIKRVKMILPEEEKGEEQAE